MQGVVVAGVLVVLQVDGHRLGVDEVGDVVGDGLAQGLVDHGGQRAQDDGDQSHRAGQDDEQRHVAEGGPVSRPDVPAVTASTMSFISQTVASGRMPWSTVRTALATVQRGAIDQTSFSARPRRSASRTFGVRFSSASPSPLPAARRSHRVVRSSTTL